LLTETGAKVSPEDLERALGYLEGAGFCRSQISVYLLVGLPGQDKKQVVESIRFVRALGPDRTAGSFSPVPGTR